MTRKEITFNTFFNGEINKKNKVIKKCEEKCKF